MRFLFMLSAGLLIFGLCGLLGGLVMLSIGSRISRIDAFGVTPFQAAVICVGVAIVAAIVVNQLVTSLFSFPFPFLMGGHEEEEEYEDDSPVIRMKKPRRRRR